MGEQQAQLGAVQESCAQPRASRKYKRCVSRSKCSRYVYRLLLLHLFRFATVRSAYIEVHVQALQFNLAETGDEEPAGGGAVAADSADSAAIAQLLARKNRRLKTTSAVCAYISHSRNCVHG